MGVDRRCKSSGKLAVAIMLSSHCLASPQDYRRFTAQSRHARPSHQRRKIVCVCLEWLPSSPKDLPIKLNRCRHVAHIERQMGSHGMHPSNEREGSMPLLTSTDGEILKRTQTTPAWIQGMLDPLHVHNIVRYTAGRRHRENHVQDAQKGHPARPQASRNRRRTPRGVRCDE